MKRLIAAHDVGLSILSVVVGIVDADGDQGVPSPHGQQALLPSLTISGPWASAARATGGRSRDDLSSPAGYSSSEYDAK
jgi:hypothetical protein